MAIRDDLLELFVQRVEDYAIYMLDLGGHVLTWNPGAERIKGYTEREIVGRHFSTFYPPEDRQKADEALRTAAETGHYEAETWRVRKDGTRFWGSVSLTALRDDAGQLKGFAKITRDLTIQKAAEERLRATEQKYDLLMAGVKEYAVFLMDAEGRIIDWSAAAERLLGYTQDEILGRHLRTFFPPGEHGPEGIPQSVLRDAAEKGRTVEESWHIRKDGAFFWGSGVTSALRDEHGGLKGFAKVLLDRTDRKRAEEELRAKAAALEEADRRKDEFLAMLAHELRNPLAPVRTGLDLLALQGADPEVVSPMRDQVVHLVRLVDDLLDVARILRGRAELSVEPVELAQVIARAVETARPGVEERRQQLTVSLPAEPARLEADPVRLTQVFSNLLDNASKYTGEGGQIQVTAAFENGHVVVRVTDTGVGIPPELLPHVFDLFTQADRTLARSQGGLGIGLSVVKSLVGMHGGSVSARSAGLGKGSEFTVRLPVIHTSRVRAAAGDAATSSVPPHAPLRRILVVDDNVALTKLVTALLRQLGMQEVSAAYDGEAAVSAAERDRPDLILLDIGLPKLDGYEVAKRLRNLPGFEHVLVVALTGYGTDEARQKSAEAGIDEHLVKPPGVEMLRQVLAHPKLRVR